MGQRGDRRIVLVDTIAVLVYTVGLINSILLAKIVILSSCVMIKTGVGDAIMAKVIVLTATVGIKIGCCELSCCWDLRWWDGLQGRLQGRLEMVPVIRNR